MLAFSKNISAASLAVVLAAVPALAQTGGSSSSSTSSATSRAGSSAGSAGMRSGMGGAARMRSGSPSVGVRAGAPGMRAGARVGVTAPAVVPGGTATPNVPAVPGTGMPSTGGTAPGGETPSTGTPVMPPVVGGGVPDTIDTLGRLPSSLIGRGTTGADVIPPPPSMGNSSLRSPRTGVVQGSMPARVTTSSDGLSDGTTGTGMAGTDSMGLSTDSGGAQSLSPSGTTSNPATGTGTSGSAVRGSDSGSAPGSSPSSSPAYSAPAVTDPTGISGGYSATSTRGRRTAGAGVTGDSSRAAYGANMEDCMSVWDADTHMTKAQWRAACARTTTRGR